MNTIESINLIYRNPKIRGGRPCIVGTDLRVLDIVVSKVFAERTPDELAEDYDLSMAEVHAALAYYYCNKDEIDLDIRDDFKRSDELAQQGLSSVERPVYQDMNPDQVQAATASAAAYSQKAATAVKALAEIRTRKSVEALEHEVE